MRLLTADVAVALVGLSEAGAGPGFKPHKALLGRLRRFLGVCPRKAKKKLARPHVI